MSRNARGANTRSDPGGEGESDRVDPRVLLLMTAGRDRDLLAEALADSYRVDSATGRDALETPFDCCIVGHGQFAGLADAIRSRRTADDEPFLPFVLLAPADADPDPEVWEIVDDVIQLPAGRAELTARVGNLVDRRLTAVELADREARLEETVAELRLKERAIDAAPVGLTISDPDQEDNPLVYANERFEQLTGYDRTEAVGRNCRFLQGEETDPETVAAIREAVAAGEPVSVDIVNYRKSGRKFWNKLDIAPVRDEDGTVTNFVGFQSDITGRKIRERRLDVLNRVLSHNLRNKMNVVEGYLELLAGEFDDPPEGLPEIEAGVRDLMGLAGAVRKIEGTIATPSEEVTAVAVDERLREMASVFADRYPHAEFSLSLPEDTPCEVVAPGLAAAVEEAIDNAVKHNDRETPTVEVRLERRADGWVDVVVVDDGPGIPEREVAVLTRGETPLSHADRLGLWLIYWVVNRVGGRFEVTDAEPRGTALTLSIPPSDDG